MNISSQHGELTEQLLKRVYGPRLQPFVKAVYGLGDSGHSAPIGSCVLVSSGKLHLLCTAAHVLKGNTAADTDPTTLYVQDRFRQFQRLDELNGISEAQLDLSVLVLRGESEYFWPDSDFLDTRGTFVRGVHLGKAHMVLGYPARRSTFERDNTLHRVTRHDPLIYGGQCVTVDSLRTHQLAIKYERRNIRQGAHTQHAPSPRGMSGGGVFLFGFPAPQLAGIVTDYPAAHTHLIATRADALLHIIHSIEGTAPLPSLQRNTRSA